LPVATTLARTTKKKYASEYENTHRHKRSWKEKKNTKIVSDFWIIFREREKRKRPMALEHAKSISAIIVSEGGPPL
jgi:hypothetical protein